MFGPCTVWCAHLVVHSRSHAVSAHVYRFDMLSEHSQIGTECLNLSRIWLQLQPAAVSSGILQQPRQHAGSICARCRVLYYVLLQQIDAVEPILFFNLVVIHCKSASDAIRQVTVVCELVAILVFC